MDDGVPEKVPDTLLRGAAGTVARAYLFAPLASVAVFVLLAGRPPRFFEVMWVVADGASALGAAWWCARHRNLTWQDRWRFRAALLPQLVTLSLIAVVFQPRPGSMQAALQLLAVADALILTCSTLAADRVQAWARCIVLVVVAVVAMPATELLPIWLKAVTMVALVGGLLPMVETIRRVITTHAVLVARNDWLVEELRAANDALAARLEQDELTGVANRTGFDRALRRSDEVGVLYVDVDHFKAVNDTFGHDAGDRVLVRVADALMAALRPNDVVARLGGDEFAVLLAGASGTTLAATAARVQASVRQAVGLDGVTVSIGGAAGDLRRETAVALLRRADAQLYDAKRAGRDQVACADIVVAS